MVSRALLAAGSLLALVSATPVLAQTAPPRANANVGANPQTEPDAIVVTAQLRQQNLTQVPLAITAYNGEFLDRLGLHDFEEASRFVPGFEVQNQSPNNPGFVIRGITSDTGTAYNEPRISVFQDGVDISKSRGSYVELFDLERIEVVRGPQSTLYGRGALIGAVNLIENKADPRGFHAFAEAGYGNYNWWMAEGMMNAPLGPNAAIRLSGRYRKRDGYIDNLLGGDAFGSTDTGAIRGAIRVLPSDRVTLDLIANYQEDHPTGTPFKSMEFVPTDPTTGAVLGDGRPWTGATLAPIAGFEGGRDLGLNRKVWGLTGLARFQLTDALSLNSTSAYRKFNALEVFDADGTSLPVITAAEDARGKQASQDLRLTYDDKGRVSGFVGASYFWERGSERTPAAFDERTVLAQITGALNGGGAIPGRPANEPAPVSLFANTAFTASLLRGIVQQNIAAQVPVGTPNRDAIILAQLNSILPQAVANGIAANLKSNHTETATNFSSTKAVDVYGDITVHVTDKFELDGGLRYSHDDKSSGISAAVLNGRSILGGFIGALGQSAPVRTALLNALAVPGAATIPPSAGYPVPLFGLTFQPTANNGDRVDQSLKDNGWSWRAAARYAIDPASEIYATYGRGRRPDVLTALPPSTPFGAARFSDVDAEIADSYEIGARHQTRHLYLDGALYYYWYRNFETTVQQGTLFVTENAGRAENYGFEGQARFQPTPNVQLFATYTYNHGRFKSGAFRGNQFRLSPDHKLSLGATLSSDVGPGRIDFTPTLTYQSKTFFDDNNDRPDLQTLASGALVPDLVQDEVQGGYSLLNARLGYTFHDRYRVEAFVTNAFNKRYFKDAGNTGDALGMPTFIGGEPRTYGVQASARF